MLRTSSVMVVALSLCSAVAAAAPASGNRAVVLFATSHPDKPGDLQAQERYLRVDAGGRWEQHVKRSGRGRSTTVKTYGVLAAAATRKLFAGLARLAARGRNFRRARRRSAPKLNQTIGLFGFGRRGRWLVSGARVSRGFARARALLAAAPAKVVRPRPARRKIGHSGHTMAGEGARWSLTFEDSGYLERSSGGDIGSGFDVFGTTRYVVGAATTRRIFAAVAKLVQRGKLKPSKPRRRFRMEGGRYTLSGFGRRPIVVDDGKAAAPLRALLARLPKAPQLPQRFFVGEVGYTARVRSGFSSAYSPAKRRRVRLPRYSTVRGRLRADGRWIVTPRRGQPVVKQIALRRAHALFAAIQRALARPKAAATAARRVARGVTYVRLRGLEPRRRRLRLSPRQRPAVFRLAKGRLERLLRVK